MKNYVLAMLAAIAISSTMCACDPDDDEPTSKSTTTTKTISKPEVKVTSHFASGSYDGWYVIGTVTTGGDDPSNVDCYLEWAKFAKKQTGTVNLSNKSRMKVTNSSKTRVQFKNEHAGINKGNYVYYRMVGSNSKYTSSTTTTYMVAQ